MFKRLFRYEDRNFAFAFTLLAGVILISILFTGKRPGVVDWGNYENTMLQAGLSYTEEVLEDTDELHYIKVIEEYEFEPFEPARFIQAKPTISLYYPVTVVRLFCQPFGILFSTANLAVVYTVMTLLSLFYIFKALYRMMGYRAAVVALWIDFMLMGSEYVAWFNSLETEACIFVGLLMFLAAILSSITTSRGNFRTIFPVIFSGWFLLNAKELYTAVMLPMVLVLVIVLAYYHRPKEGLHSRTVIWMCVFTSLMTVSSLNLARNSYVLGAQANRYDAVYGGLLMVCEDPEQVIADLGLPKETIEDVGKSFYLDESDYAFFPRGDAAKKPIYEHIDVSKMAGYYATHPKQFLLMLKETIPYSSTYTNNRFLYVGEKTDENGTTVTDNFWWSLVRKILIPSNITFYYVFNLIALLICVVYYILCKKDSIRIRIIVYIAFLCMAFTQLFMPFMLNGWGYMYKEEFSFTLMEDIILLFTVVFLMKVAYLLGAQISEGEEAWEEEAYLYSCSVEKRPFSIWNKIKGFFQKIGSTVDRTIWSHRIRATLVMTLFAGLVIFYVMFLPPRIGARNNGDFGRVMNAIGIRYTQEYRIEHDLPTKMVVEDFEWQYFDWNRLTYQQPALSNVYVASVLRLIDEPRGVLYSTYRASVIYALILWISFGVIFYQLYDLFGKKKFLILAPICIIMFLGKMHLGWINSLFGEGVIFVSLVAVIACSLSIINAKQGKGLWIFIPLMFFVRMLCGSKGQMTVSAPFLILFVMILLFYHYKKAKWYWKMPLLAFVSTACVLVGIASVGLYQQNDNENSALTVWQSMFTGLLVVCDDPVETLKDFDMDPRMAVDIGKHAYYEDSEYFIGPLTDKAQTEIFAKVDTMKILKYYIAHPVYLYRILDRVAGNAAALMPDWFMFLGQRNDLEHDIVNRFSAWEEFRAGIVPRYFLSYVVIYAIMICNTVLCMWKDRKKDCSKTQLLRIFFLLITILGIVQYPLSAIGNGTADNTKQMYMFRLCFDIDLLFAGYIIIQKLAAYRNRKSEAVNETVAQEGIQTDGIEEDLV